MVAEDNTIDSDAQAGSDERRFSISMLRGTPME